jgi:hypothetical protein
MMDKYDRLRHVEARGSDHPYSTTGASPSVVTPFAIATGALLSLFRRVSFPSVVKQAPRRYDCCSHRGHLHHSEGSGLDHNLGVFTSLSVF